MSSVKRFIERQQAEEERQEWVEEQVDFDVVPGDEEWVEMEKMYDKRLMEGSLYEPQFSDNWSLDEEVEWSKTNPHSIAFNDFCSQIMRLGELMGASEDPMQQKIQFSFVVTLMESCLSEMLKSITLSSPEFKKNALTNVYGLKDATIKVNHLLNSTSDELIEKTIINHLTGLIYHNIETVLKVYKAVLGRHIENLTEDMIRKINDATALRHDIVHRNGKKATGEPNEISRDIIDAHIENINQLVDHLFLFINQSIPDTEDPEF